MADLIKLDMTNIWANGGDKVDPGATKVNGGWQVEAVPRQTWNWMQNRVDQNIAYMLQKGFPEWDNLTEYQTNKSYVQRNNIVYKCIQVGINQDPQTATTYWVRAFADYSVAAAALGATTAAANTLPYYTSTTAAATTPLTAFARTLLDDADATTARTTLAAQASNANLTALSALGGANNQFPYYTGATTFGLASLTAFARTILDDADAASVRATLGLGTSAVATLTVGNADGTSGRVTTVGDYGWGAGSNGLPAMDPPSNGTAGDANLCTLAGVYRISSTTVNVPAGFGQGATMITLMWNNATGAQIITQNGSSAMRGGSGLNTTPTWTSWLGTWNTNNLVKTASQVDVTTGSITKVGDFGIGSVDNAPLANDANAVTISGMYATNVAGTITNYPAAVNGQLIHSEWNGASGASQIFIPTATNQMFFRNQTAGVWQPWKELIHTGNQQTLIDAATTAAVSQAATSAANLYFPKTGGTITGPLIIDNPTTGTMSIEIGSKTRTTTPFIDFNSSAGGTDYDSRIIASGGSATAGQGSLSYIAKGGHFFTQGPITSADGFFGTLTGSITGNANGNAGTATALQTARTISLSGGASGSVSFNGTANVAIPVTIAISGVTGLQAALDGKLASTDISNNYYNKTQTDGRYPLGTNSYLNIANGGVPTMSQANDTYGANSLAIHNGNNNAAIAAISFVRDSSFGTWFGLDTDNSLAWGGWSHGAVRYVIWSEKNFNPANYVSFGGLSGAIVGYTPTGNIGSYAMLVNTSGSNISAGQTLGTGLTYASTTSNAGGAAGGTWRAHGNGNTNGTSLWMRIA